MTLLTLLDQPPTTMLSSFRFVDGSVVIRPLSNAEESEVLEFLSARPIHTVFMVGFIRDNGIISPLNRGTFYACRDKQGRLEGVALIGHATLIEASTDEAMAAFARLAQKDARARIIFGEEARIQSFWHHYSEAGPQPSMICRELLLEQRWPSEDFLEVAGLRLATLDDLDHVVTAHAALAVEELGINPLEDDPIGFRLRTARRIERGRAWVLIENNELIFKCDIVADTPDVIYIEGVYVSRSERRRGYGARCLMQMGRELLTRSVSISLLVNERNEAALRVYRKAGFQLRSYYNSIILPKPRLKACAASHTCGSLTPRNPSV
jgi:predicted GNAT family acetyltransferase